MLSSKACFSLASSGTELPLWAGTALPLWLADDFAGFAKMAVEPFFDVSPFFEWPLANPTFATTATEPFLEWPFLEWPFLEWPFAGVAILATRIPLRFAEAVLACLTRACTNSSLRISCQP